MNTILIVDIETTGFIEQGGKIVEIGIVKLNLATGKVTSAYSSLIKEKGFDISHTKGKLGWIFKNSNLTFKQVDFAPSLESQKDIIQGLFDEYQATAYNKEFDFGFLKKRGFRINELPCPMLIATQILKLPSVHGYGDYKWPKVEEAWEYFLGETGYKEAHRGLDDAMHEAKIVYELFKLGKFKVDEKDGQTLENNNEKKKESSFNLLQPEFFKIKSLVSDKVFTIENIHKQKFIYQEETLKWAISDRNIDLYQRIYKQIPISFDHSHMNYAEIKDNVANIGYTNGADAETILTTSLIYIDLLLKGLKPIKALKDKHGNLPLLSGTVITDENFYHLIDQVVFSVEELLIDAKVFNLFQEFGYSCSEIWFCPIHKYYISYYEYFNGYELDAIEEYGLPECDIKVISNQDDLIKKGSNNLMLAVKGYLEVINPQYAIVEKQKRKEYANQYKSINNKTSIVLTKIDNILNHWIHSPKSDHHFYIQYILRNILKINDLWLGYEKVDDFPNKGFFIGDEF